MKILFKFIYFELFLKEIIVIILKFKVLNIVLNLIACGIKIIWKFNLKFKFLGYYFWVYEWELVGVEL